VQAGDPGAAPPCEVVQTAAAGGGKAPLIRALRARDAAKDPLEDFDSSALADPLIEEDPADPDDPNQPDDPADPTDPTDPTKPSNPTDPSDPDVVSTAGLVNTGLWGATIALVAAGVLLAAVAAVFAVVNTATTPVEAVSGVPGLYLWNGLAAGMQALGAACWGAQHATALSHNVLVLDADEGWTTEGGEALGYSFWLVVVAAVVHLLNVALIAFGTYEPKVKEKIQEPDKATNDILLY